MRGKELTLVIIAASFGVLATVPAVASTPNKSLQIPLLDVAPRLDGKLDDAVWAEATLVTELLQVEPLEYAPAAERTEIRVFYTRHALYVGARLFQDPTRITANIQKQGADAEIWNDDWFGFDVDPWNARRNGYFFIVNANGVRWDGSFKNISDIDNDWTGIWQGEAARDESGWTAEFELPFNALSFDPGSDTWGMNFERRIALTGEYLAWSSRGQLVNPSTNGSATGFADLQQGLGLGVVPSVIARTTRAGSHSRSGVDPSLDVFYRITPELTATLTANTDFSATDADTRQVNLTRFSLFFPEKRDFFLRDADIFEFGHLADNGRPFFSRRIGLNRFGRPIDIDYGAKLSGHFGALDLGTLYIRQGDDPETGIGARDIVVARAAAHVLEESSVGVMLTHGDPQSELDNTLAGADFSLRHSRLSGGRDVRLDGWYQQSESEGAGRVDDAWGLALSTAKPVGWFAASSYKRLGAAFDPALGFVNRAGISDWTSKAGYTWRFGRERILSLVKLTTDYYRAETLADDRLGSSVASFTANLGNQSGDLASLAVYQSEELLTGTFMLGDVTIPAGRYTFGEAEATLTANPARKLSVSASLRSGGYYDGTHAAGEIAFAWKPNRHLNATVAVSEDRLRLPGGDLTVRLMSAGLTVAFDSHWSWTGLAQYDNLSEMLGINSRLHWTPRAGRNAYLVVNLGREDVSGRMRSIGREIVLKYNHDLRF